MKKIIILDCGPSLKEVTVKFGGAPDWIISILNSNNYKFKCIKLYDGESIDTKFGDAWIITGSPRSVYENADWMLELENKIKLSIRRKLPILGICFGHQLLAKCFGGTVALNEKGWELGSYPIYLTDHGKAASILDGINNNDIVYESHQDCVTKLPDEALELAYNEKAVQAFSINDHIFGVQFHPEFSFDIINKYVNVRSAKGILVDNLKITESEAGKNVLYNFVKKI